MLKPSLKLLLIALVALCLPLMGSTWAADAPKGELDIVFPGLWNEGLDPILTSSSGSIGLAAMYDSLVGAKPDGSGLSKKTGIADNWKMSPDGKVWTIHIRHGVQFQRGFGEVTAQDVKFSIDRITSAHSVAQRKGWFKKNIGKVVVVNRYTVKVYAAKNPIPDFLVQVSPLSGSVGRFVVSKKAVEKLGEQGFAVDPVGSGPYGFVKHVGGQYILLQAVKHHWRLKHPRFEYVRFMAVPEQETSIAMLSEGQADVVPISRDNIKRVKAKGLHVVLVKGAYALNVFLDDQFVPTVPVHNQKVREALNLAVDRQTIADTIYEGHGRPIGDYYTQTKVLDTLGYNWKKDLYPYDPAKAKELLKEAGYPNGFDIDVYIYPWIGVPEGPQTVQAVAGMWNAIGEVTSKGV